MQKHKANPSYIVLSNKAVRTKPYILRPFCPVLVEKLTLPLLPKIYTSTTGPGPRLNIKIVFNRYGDWYDDLFDIGTPPDGYWAVCTWFERLVTVSIFLMVNIMASWYGNSFSITALCEGNPPVTCGFPWQMGLQMRSFTASSVAEMKNLLTNRVALIWDAATLVRRHCNLQG